MTKGLEGFDEAWALEDPTPEARSAGSEALPGFIPEMAAEPEAPPTAPLPRPPAPDPWRTAKLAAGAGARGAAGFFGMPGNIGQGLQWAFDETLGKYVLDPWLTLAGRTFGKGPEYDAYEARKKAREAAPPGFGTSQQLIGGLEALGAAGPEPFDSDERLLYRTAEGAGSAVPLAFMNPSAALPYLAGGAGAGLAGETARQVAAEHAPDYELPAELAGSLIGAVGGTGAGEKVGRAGRAITDRLQGRVPEALQSFATAGVQPMSVADVTGGSMARRMQQGAQTAPASAPIMERAYERTTEQLQQSIDDVATRLGGAQTNQQAGESLQNAARGWLQNWRQESRQRWGDLYNRVGRDTPVPGTNTGARINQLLDEIPENEANRRILGDLRRWRDTFNADTVRTGGTYRFETAHRIRQEIDEQLGDRTIVGTTSERPLRNLRAALTTDLRATAQSLGLEDLWDNANRLTREGHALVKNVVSKLLGTKPDQEIEPERAYGWLTSQLPKGGTRVARATTPGQQTDRVIPEPVLDEVAGRRLTEAGGRLGLTPMREAAGQAPGNLSQEAFERLYRDPAVRDRLRAIADIQQRMDATFRAVGNPSRTAPSLMAAQAMTAVPAIAAGGLGYLASPYAGAEEPDARIGAAMAALASTYFGPRAAARILTSPAAQRFAATPRTLPAGVLPRVMPGLTALEGDR